jgi:hypothetical protein
MVVAQAMSPNPAQCNASGAIAVDTLVAELGLGCMQVEASWEVVARTLAVDTWQRLEAMASPMHCQRVDRKARSVAAYTLMLSLEVLVVGRCLCGRA